MKGHQANHWCTREKATGQELSLEAETNIPVPEEIGITYSYLLCAAIQVWCIIIMLIPRFS